MFGLPRVEIQLVESQGATDIYSSFFGEGFILFIFFMIIFTHKRSL